MSSILTLAIVRDLLQRKGSDTVVSYLSPFEGKAVSRLLNERGDFGQRLLHVLCEENAVSAVRFLLSKHSGLMDLDVQDESGWTPLVVAGKHCRLRLCELLLVAGARPAVLTRDGTSFLHYVVRRAPEADEANAADRVIDLAVSGGLAIDLRSATTGETALHCAVAGGHPSWVSALVQARGASLTTLNAKGLSPLHVAVLCDSAPACELLLRHGADPHLASPLGTPLSLASPSLAPLLSRYDLRNRVSPDDPFGLIEVSNLDRLRQLLDAQPLSAPSAAPPHLPPFLYAAYLGNLAALRVFFSAQRVDFRACDARGRGALHHLLRAGERQRGDAAGVRGVAERMVRQYGVGSGVDAEGEGVVFAAVRGGAVEAVQWVAIGSAAGGEGGDPRRRNRAGESAEDVARAGVSRGSGVSPGGGGVGGVSGGVSPRGEVGGEGTSPRGRAGAVGAGSAEVLALVREMDGGMPADPAVTAVRLSGMARRLVPWWVWQMDWLLALDLSGNALQALPPVIRRLRALRVLDLSRNALQTLPGALGELTALRVLRLRGNPELPRHMRFAYETETLARFLMLLRTAGWEDEDWSDEDAPEDLGLLTMRDRKARGEEDGWGEVREMADRVYFAALALEEEKKVIAEWKEKRDPAKNLVAPDSPIFY